MIENATGSEPQTFDGETGELDPAPSNKRPYLSSIRDVRLEMAALYRQVKRAQMESGEANKRVWLLRQIADLIVIAELEQRINALEGLRPASIGVSAGMLN